MDPVISQLFSLDEILDRIGRNHLTGGLHVFTPKESANIFFKEGVVIAALNGLFEGEDVLRKVLDWKGSQFMWQTNAKSPTPPQKPLKLNITDFLSKLRPSPGLAVTGNLSIDLSPNALTPPKEKPSAPLQAITTPKTTMSADGVKPVEATQAELSVTKNILNSSENRAVHDKELLAKYKLILVSVDSPAQRLKISQASSLIGRNPACDITIVHSSISRQHCLLQMTDRGLHVKDLDTTNGTKVNGIVLKEGYINIGDKLTLGHLVFILEKE